jgi:hypothetical protein
MISTPRGVRQMGASIVLVVDIFRRCLLSGRLLISSSGP